MSKNVIGICGVLVFHVGIFLPFAELKQSNEDILPLVMSVICFVSAGGLLVLALSPQWFRRYAIIVGILCGTAAVLLVAGFFHSFGGLSASTSTSTKPETRLVSPELPK